MDNNTVRVFSNFYCSVRTAYEASRQITPKAFLVISSYATCFMETWKDAKNAFADQFYKSQNFQTLNDRMNFLMTEKPTMIAFGAALTEIHDYTNKLAEEFDLLRRSDV